MKQHFVVLILVLLAGLFVPAADLTIAHAQAASPVVHAVLFYSPTCPHCHYVITETLPPLFEKYGDQLQIISIDVTSGDGQTLFQAALQKFNLKEGGVPFLVIGKTFLVGSADIPDKLPELIDSHLAQGGVDWPDIPGLRNVLAQSLATEAAKPTGVAATTVPSSASPVDGPDVGAMDSANSSWQVKFGRDVRGNTLATVLLAAMLAALAWVIGLLLRGDRFLSKNAWDWLIPVLCAMGLGVAGYLAYVESAQVSAVCGPIGDCNTVQHSPYARLWGVLPIGVLGLVGYAAILAAWIVAQRTDGRVHSVAIITSFALAAFGTIFSIYLTYLEPFVIGATCAWCLTSSVLMTILMLVAVKPARAAYGYHWFAIHRCQKRKEQQSS